MSELQALAKDFQSQGDTVLEKLTEWAQDRGEQICVYYGDEEQAYSFRCFNRLCNRVANGLAAMGVSKADRVSVLSKNAFVTSIAMFATWKLGALYCPINNAYKGELLSYIINDTGPKVLLVDQQFVARLNAIQSDIAELPELLIHEPEIGAHDYDDSQRESLDQLFSSRSWATLLEHSDSDPGVSVYADDLANIIYTSGTTGQPKGVVQSHKWIHAYNYYALKTSHADYVIHSDLPLYHVGGAMLSVAGAVWAGCRLALWDRFSPESFWQRIRQSGATHALLVDTMIDWLMNAPVSESDRDHGLKIVNMTPLPANHNAMAQRFGIEFVQTGYGSTELGVGFIGLIDELGADYPKPKQWQRGHSRELIRRRHTELGGGQSLLEGCATVRKGFMGSVACLVDVKLVDANGKDVAPDQPGQLAFRHKLPATMFCEYFNKPSATDKAVRDGWYYPNDVVSVDDNGIYYFEDRQQGFIRVRGENLSATTVEQQMQYHPAVSRCAVVGVPAEQGNEQDIAAFVVLKPKADATAEDLQHWAREQLPKFMWPRHLRIVATLPVTPTFKVEKYKLAQQLIAEQAARPHA